MDSKICSRCGETKELDMFAINRSIKSGRGAKCKDCATILWKEKYNRYIEDNGGMNRVNQYPNEFECELQKTQTFEFLKAIGWQFNEMKKIWWKEGIKTKDGVFLNIKKKKRIARTQPRKKKTYFDYELIYKGEWRKAIEVVPRWIEMYEKGLTYEFISKSEKTTKYIIKKFITLYYETR